MTAVEAPSSIFRPFEPTITECYSARKDEHLYESVTPDGVHILNLTYPNRYGKPVERDKLITDRIAFLPFDVSNSGSNEIEIVKGIQPRIKRVIQFPLTISTKMPSINLSAVESETGNLLYKANYSIDGGIVLDPTKLVLSPSFTKDGFPANLSPESLISVCSITEAIKNNRNFEYDFSRLKIITGSFELLGLPTKFPSNVIS